MVKNTYCSYKRPESCPMSESSKLSVTQASWTLTPFSGPAYSYKWTKTHTYMHIYASILKNKVGLKNANVNG